MSEAQWFGHLIRLPENAPAKQALAEARKPYKKISGDQTTTWLSTIKKDFSEINHNLKEAFDIAYDRDMYTQLVCRAVARSHKAEWRRKRRLKEESAGPEACGRRQSGSTTAPNTVRRTNENQLLSHERCCWSSLV